jgi:hypothetical protein
LFEYLPDQGGLGRLDIDNKLLLKGISNYQKVVSAIRNKTSLDAVPAEPTVPRPERRKKSSSKPSP